MKEREGSGQGQEITRTLSLTNFSTPLTSFPQGQSRVRVCVGSDQDGGREPGNPWGPAAHGGTCLCEAHVGSGNAEPL